MAQKGVDVIPDAVNINEINTVVSELDTWMNCPCCFNMISLPFLGCPNGHIVCNDCLPKVQQCPSCRNKKLDCRQLGMENIASKKSWPCNLAHMGCKHVMKMDKFQEHTKKCKFVATQCCPFGQCSDEIMMQPEDIIQHMKDVHDMAVEKISSSRQNTNIKIKFEIRDYKKKKMDKKTLKESSRLFEIDETLFFLSVIETEKNVSFRSTVIAPSSKIDDKYVFHREFTEVLSRERHTIVEPIKDISERAGMKRKAVRDNDLNQDMFMMEKKKMGVFTRVETNLDGQFIEVVEFCVKFPKLRTG
jgi:hypothetical protein